MVTKPKPTATEPEANLKRVEAVGSSGVADATTGEPSSAALGADAALALAAADTTPLVAPLPSTRITRSLEPPLKAFSMFDTEPSGTI